MLEIRSGTTYAAIDSDEGAVITAFTVNGKEILAPDGFRETKQGLKRRGGMPLLFPNAGLLPAGNPYTLAQHGFARELPWKTVSALEDEVVLVLTSDPETHQQFPYDFALTLTVTVVPGSVATQLKVTNTGEISLPVAPGWHPYFSIPNADRLQVITTIPTFDLTTYNWSDVIFFEGQEIVELCVPGREAVVMQTSSQFKKIVVWTEPGADYLCIEPWVGMPNALIDPAQVVTIEPGMTEEFITTITV